MAASRPIPKRPSHSQLPFAMARTSSPSSAPSSSPSSRTPSFMAEDPSLSDVSSLEDEDYRGTDYEDGEQEHNEEDEDEDGFHFIPSQPSFYHGPGSLATSATSDGPLAGSCFALVANTSDDENGEPDSTIQQQSPQQHSSSDADLDGSSSEEESGRNLNNILASGAPGTRAQAGRRGSQVVVEPAISRQATEPSSIDRDLTPEASGIIQAAPTTTTQNSWMFPDPTSPVQSVETLRHSNNRFAYSGSGSTTPVRMQRSASSLTSAVTPLGLPRSVDTPPARLNVVTALDSDRDDDESHSPSPESSLKHRKVARANSRRQVSPANFATQILDGENHQIAQRVSSAHDWKAKTQQWLQQSPRVTTKNAAVSTDGQNIDDGHGKAYTKQSAQSSANRVYMMLVLVFGALFFLYKGTVPQGHKTAIPGREMSLGSQSHAERRLRVVPSPTPSATPAKPTPLSWTARLVETCPTCDLVVVNTVGKSVSIYRAAAAAVAESEARRVATAASSASASPSASSSPSTTTPDEETGSFWGRAIGSNNTSADEGSSEKDWVKDTLLKHLFDAALYARKAGLLAAAEILHEWRYWEAQLLQLWLNHLSPILKQLKREAEASWSAHYPAAAQRANELFQSAESFYKNNFEESVKVTGQKFTQSRNEASQTAYRLAQKWASQGGKELKRMKNAHKAASRGADRLSRQWTVKGGKGLKATGDRVQRVQKDASRTAYRLSRQWIRHGSHAVRQARDATKNKRRPSAQRLRQEKNASKWGSIKRTPLSHQKLEELKARFIAMQAALQKAQGDPAKCGSGTFDRFRCQKWGSNGE